MTAKLQPGAPGRTAPCPHRPERRHGTAALRGALVLTLVVMLVEVGGGLIARSLALLADAAHMATDAAAIGLSLFAAWVAAHPADDKRTYGWYRVEILAALVNGALLLVVTAGIVREAFARLSSPVEIRAGIMLGVATLGLAANLAAAFMLHRAKGESLNVRGAYLHVLSDLGGSLAAILAGAIVLLTGWVAADAIVSLALAGLLVFGALRLMKQSVDVLLEAAPRHVSIPALEASIVGVPGVNGVHDLHVWTVASGMVAMSAHATVGDPARHQEVLEEITRRARGAGIQHVTVQLEKSAACPE
jgi:cobalt-zinc-cadmium efflux system protein